MARFIISIIGIGLAGGIFFFYTKPTYDGAQSQRDAISQYNAALDRAAELAQIKQALLSRFNGFNPTDVDRLQKLLPDHVDNVRLILDLDSIATRHSMALQNVVVSSDQDAKETEGSVGAIGASRQQFNALTMKFATQGPYESFLAFLLDLEQSLRIVDLVDLKLTPSQDSYSYEVTIKTYWLK